MDTTEQYIKMRVAAIPDLGRGEPPESTFRSDNYYAFENVKYSVFVAPNGNWYTFYPTIKYDNKQGRTCQLERQDQLQEMVDREISCLIQDFYSFFFGDPSDAPFVTSMEQLWLAFVMAELHQKKWDGSKWIL